MNSLPKHILKKILLFISPQKSSNSPMIIRNGPPFAKTVPIMWNTSPYPARHTKQSIYLRQRISRFLQTCNMRSKTCDVSKDSLSYSVLNEPSGLPEPGGIKYDHPKISWIADNQMKGISNVSALTIHSTADFVPNAAPNT